MKIICPVRGRIFGASNGNTFGRKVAVTNCRSFSTRHSLRTLPFRLMGGFSSLSLGTIKSEYGKSARVV